ncbi:GMC family oxidoreductase [Aspergillus foveolatus]|uniref:GMC family oxidoreductase n=1 Tax=Aspergillus foveolatus TaxID=210207 RepID=UPI003CCD5884
MATFDSRFDFIVIGGGTAGNTAAGRLASNPSVRILVIEAGAPNPYSIPEITTPSSAMDLRGSIYDWAYKTTLVKRDDYERIEKPNTRGKVLGGSSSLNYFTWLPGCKPTFDMWREYGGADWTWEKLLPYLRKSATYHDDLGIYPAELQKIGPGDGPIHISHAELLDGMQSFRDAITTAWKNMEETVEENVYDGEMLGLTHCVDSIYQGQRSGSWLFVRDKPNVIILSGAYSKRLVIDDKTCKGVTAILSSGEEQTFYASREVVLSQGVFETPKLLMLSGIGPAEQLVKHGISPILDSPHVGQNLIDHPGVPFVLQVKEGYGMDDYLLRKGSEQNKAAQSIYETSRTGPVSSGLLELVGFPRVDKYLERDEHYRRAKEQFGGKDPFSPDGQPHFELDFVCMFGSAFQWHYPVPKKGNYLTVVVDLVRPISDPGEVTLIDSDPLTQPAINLNFFSSDLDIIAMREGIRFSYDLLTKVDGFRELVIAEYPWEMPLDNDAEMKRAVLDRCQTAFHPVGTARLSKDVKQGVVDPELRVHGIKGLRVADASVIPVIPDCRIQNSVYMVGEKCADLIKESHRDLY